MNDTAVRNRIVAILAVALAALAVAGVLLRGHANFAIAAIPGFPAWFGVIAALAVVLFARVWHVLLRRRADYYAEGERD